ncbi:hypothetical protein QQ045_032153 [Rhodiola kirilowii]
MARKTATGDDHPPIPLKMPIQTSAPIKDGLSRAFPELPILTLVDWNSAGLAILCTFKYGSLGMDLEAYRYGTVSNDNTSSSIYCYFYWIEFLVP